MATTLTTPSRRVDAALFPVTEDITGLTTLLVNVFFIGAPGSDDWVLIDAAIPGQANRIARAAAELYSAGNPPKAIILTHGHFDHVGSLHAMLELWPDTPLYAHWLELPYLTGQADYPPPDPSVGGGMLARTSRLLPRRAYDFRPHIHPLPHDYSLPHLDGWRWVHTPGHTPGHIALFRDSDRTLLPADAFCTQKQESLLGVLTQKLVIHGPPMYFTSDWVQARASVQKLAALHPTAAAPSHGLPIYHPRLEHDLTHLATHFDEGALPTDGRYVREPVITDSTGSPLYIPPPPPGHFARNLALAAFATIALIGITSLSRRDRD